MKDLTKGNTFITLLKFSIPLIVAGLITQSYNLVDLIIAGKFIGDEALSATGATTSLIQFISAFFWGYGIACSSRTGKEYGHSDYKDIFKSFNTCFVFLLAFMLFFCGACITFSRSILMLFKVDESIFESANSYFIIYVTSLVSQAVLYQISTTLQTLGDSKYPMFLTITSGILNVILNIIFVVPIHMGVNGLAIATLISCTLAAVLGLIKINKNFKKLGGKFKLEFDKEEFKAITKIAIPCILQQCSLYFSALVVQLLINDKGVDYTAAYALAMNVSLVYNAIYHSISRTVASYSAQSLGSKQYDNFNKGILVGFLLQVLINAPIMIINFIFPEAIFSIFLQDESSNVLTLALPFVYICVPFIAVVSYGNLMHSFFKNVECSNVVLITTLLFTISRILFAILLPNNNNLHGVYWSLSLAWVVEAIILLVMYNTVFKRKIAKLKELAL